MFLYPEERHIDIETRTTTTETTDRVLKVVTELATITTTTTEFLSPATTIIPTVTIFADPVTVTVTPLPLPNDQLPQIYARTWKPPSCNRIADGILAMNHAPYILEEACKCLELRPRTALLQSMAEPTTVTFTSTGTVTAFILESALLTAVSVAWESDISTTTSVSFLQFYTSSQIGDTDTISNHADNNSHRDGNRRPLRSSLQRQHPARRGEYGARGHHCKHTG